MGFGGQNYHDQPTGCYGWPSGLNDGLEEMRRTHWLTDLARTQQTSRSRCVSLFPQPTWTSMAGWPGGDLIMTSVNPLEINAERTVEREVGWTTGVSGGNYPKN